MKTSSITLLSTTTLVFWLLAVRGMAAAPDALNAADVAFVKREAAASLAVARVADLGVKKAGRAAVKALAEMIFKDHTAAHAEWVKLAAVKGVELSAEINPEHAGTYQQLEKSGGTNFDQDFLQTMVTAHQKCVGSFEAAAREVRDSDVRVFAIKTLPMLKSHLGKAQELSTGSTTRVTTAPDNTARNARDRVMVATLTPADQGSSKADTSITAQIRRDVIALNNVSVNVRNVKIITLNGRVTLRGPVSTAEEQRLIGFIAERIARAKNVDNQLEVKSVAAAN